MRKTLFTLMIGALLSLAGVTVALAEDYTVPVIVNGEPMTLTIKITDGVPITVALSITDAVVGPITALRNSEVVTSTNGWATLVDNPFDLVRKEEDKFSKTTFYVPDVTVLTASDLDDAMSGLHILPYVGEKEDQTWVRFAGSYIVYSKDDFVSAREVWILAGDESFYISLAAVLVDTDFHGYTNSGDFDMLADETILEALKAIVIAGSGEIRMRDMYGHTYERELNEQELSAVKIAIAVYAQLGGEVD